MGGIPLGVYNLCPKCKRWANNYCHECGQALTGMAEWGGPRRPETALIPMCEQGFYVPPLSLKVLRDIPVDSEWNH